MDLITTRKMICRLCLRELHEEDGLCPFEAHTKIKDIPLVEIILKYLYIEIIKDDPISTTLCYECYNHLDEFHNFFTYVEQKQCTLRNEFLEIKCDIVLPESIPDHDNEMLMDLKHIPLQNETEEEVTPILSEIDMKIEVDSLLNFEANAKDDGSSIDDDVPLLCLKNKMKSKKKGSKKRKLKIKLNGEDNCQDKTQIIRGPAKKTVEFIDKSMKLNCDICNAPIECFKDLRTHFDTLHNEAPYVKCCNRKYKKPCLLAEHIKWHQDPTAYKCDVCNKKLRSKTCLRVHKEFAHCEDDGPSQSSNCPVCNKEFRSQKCLQKHILRHKSEKQYNCEKCDKIFATTHRLQRHVESIHENICKHICDICGKKFKFKPSFEKHILEHQGIIQPSAQCDTCGQWLKNKDALRLHRFKHDKTDVECKFCGRICASYTALKGHIQYMHKQKKLLQCSFCDKTFKTTQSLEEHMAIHTGTQLYSCPHCRKECRSRANMYVHIKRHHVDEWMKSKIARSNNPMLKEMAAAAK